MISTTPIKTVSKKTKGNQWKELGCNLLTIFDVLLHFGKKINIFLASGKKLKQQNQSISVILTSRSTNANHLSQRSVEVDCFSSKLKLESFSSFFIYFWPFWIQIFDICIIYFYTYLVCVFIVVVFFVSF